MKHNLLVIATIVLLFFAAQAIGLVITSKYIEVPELPLGLERPEIEGAETGISLFVMIIIVTLIALLFVKFALFRFWKIWFLVSVILCLIVSLNAFIPQVYAVIAGIVFGAWKVFKPNIFVHNATELFIYAALAAIFVPILNIWAAALLLLLISIYDYIAVMKTKHMIKFAKFQARTKMFAGLFVPYENRHAANMGQNKGQSKIIKRGKESESVKENIAILGGGDIGFPLLFAGVVLKELGGILSWQAFIVPVAVSLVLFCLFLFGKKKKFYPAMPYLTAGCLIGYLVVRLIS
ncbi:hypothetical protein HZB88_04370 [archaeon]|nr:hypothetical protein [archaeon]